MCPIVQTMMLLLVLLPLLTGVVAAMSTLEQAIENVGLKVACRQVDNIQKIPRCFRGEERMTVMLALNADLDCWERTLPPSVFHDRTLDKWRIRFRFYKSRNAKTPTRYIHPYKYESEKEAFEDLLNVRYSKESATCKAKIDRVLNGEISILEPAPEKRRAVDSEGGAPRKKRTTMRSNYDARMSSIPNRNPRCTGDLNPYTLCPEQSRAADAIGNEVIRRRLPFISRAVRDNHMRILEKGIRGNGKEWYCLIPHGEDKEVRVQAGPKAIAKVKEQATLVHKALGLYNDMIDSKLPTELPQDSIRNSTWRQACNDAVKAELSTRNGQTVERWYIAFCCNSEQPLCFPLNRQGKASNEAR